MKIALATIGVVALVMLGLFALAISRIKIHH